jgi:hypothetical protein
MAMTIFLLWTAERIDELTKLVADKWSAIITRTARAFRAAVRAFSGYDITGGSGRWPSVYASGEEMRAVEGSRSARPQIF